MRSESAGLLTTGQAANLCAVTPDTVLKWIKRGRLVASRTAGGHYRIALPDLEPFLASFGQKSSEAAGSLSAAEGDPASDPGPGEGAPCWEYLSADGAVRSECRQCVVYRVRATRCFLMARLDGDVGHARQFCHGSCDDCVYFRRLRGGRTRILFITTDEELVAEVGRLDASLEVRFARNGYEASAVVQKARPDVIVLDLDGVEEPGPALLDSISGDARLPDVRVILVGPEGTVGRMMRRPRHRLVADIVEKPRACEGIVAALRHTRQAMPGPGDRTA